MSHFKINKDSLDYDYYAMFHSYTMNNFVRNIMRKGKYKKALRIVRLGLLGAIKKIYNSLLQDVFRGPTFAYIPLNFKRATFTILAKKTKRALKKKYTEIKNEIMDNQMVKNQLKEQYTLLKEEFKFKKIYTKKPSLYFFKNRNYTVFDLVIQVYTMLANVWYMRKMKASGRTILVPTPLRPYRRISVVTQMIMKGLRKMRRSERFRKNAIIHTISQEFWQLGLYYHPVLSHPTITASNIWQLKLQSQKELVANLKNIKYSKYI